MGQLEGQWGGVPAAVGQGAMQGAPRRGNPHDIDAANDHVANYQGPSGVSDHIRITMRANQPS